MKNLKFSIQNFKVVFCILCFAFCVSTVRAQSTSQSYPTPIVTNEITGTIKPRDIGDARLTDYFYTFNSSQGDVFINVVTTNFNGDIDIFNADGLKPITKIVVYADTAVNETGRVIYFRKPEKLILRIEGRTPNDDAATFKIKFAGSFVAAADVKFEEPLLPEVTSANQTDVRVNSVGTIIEIKPKPVSSPIETAAKNNNSKETVKEISVEMNAEKSVIAETGADKKDERKIEVKEVGQSLKVVVTENTPVEKDKSAQSIAENKTEKAEITETPNSDETGEVKKITIDGTAISKTDNDVSDEKTEVTAAATKPKKTRPAKIVKPNPLENIHLIVLFKDGKKIERPMSEVLKVGVDKGVLTIISKNGTIGRYSILDIAKMTIE
jgi:hypothetical protein